MCTTCSDRVADMYADVKNTCITYTIACTGALDTCLVHAKINAKNAHTPVQARPCDVAATSSPCKLLLPILQLELSPRYCQNPHQPMAQSQMRYHTGIIWSSAFARALSSLSVAAKMPFYAGRRTALRGRKTKEITSINLKYSNIRDDVKLAQLVRARDCQSWGRRFDSVKNSKNRELKSTWIWDT